MRRYAPTLLMAMLGSGLLGYMLLGSGCSNLLGLGSFTDQHADASADATGGTAGAGGSGGTDAGSGPRCRIESDPFTVFQQTYTLGALAYNSLFVVPSGGNAYVVMGTQNGKLILVGHVTGETQPGSNIVARLTPNPPIYVTSAQIVTGTLHVMGLRGDPTTTPASGVDLSLSSGVDGGLLLPPKPIPLGCASAGQVIVRYGSDSKRHWAATCVPSADGGANKPSILVDGPVIVQVSTGTELSSFVLAGSEGVILTENTSSNNGGPPDTSLYHLSLPVTLPSGLLLNPVPVGPFDKSSSQQVFTDVMLAWPVGLTKNTSVLGIELTKQDSGMPGPPAAFWQGVFGPGQFGQLSQSSSTTMKRLFDMTNESDFTKYRDPEPIQGGGTVIAGLSPQFPGQTVRFSVFSAGGTPRVVQQTAATGEQIVDAAAGGIGQSVLVVWNVQNGNTSTVEGQVFDCH